MTTATTTCPQHGGPWGDDLTCAHCTDSDGSPRPHTSRRYLALAIDLEGAAFADGFADQEVAAILRKTADRIAGGALGSSADDPLTVGAEIKMLDVNGNTVGVAEVRMA